MRLKNRDNPRTPRRAFTLVEVLVAGVITAFVIGSVSMTVSQLARSKNTVRNRLNAALRADSALTAVRSDVVSIIRDSDLFYTRFKLIDDVRDTAVGPMDRDELLVFNTRLRSVRDMTYQGEGLEYETQYRIQEDDTGPVLWQRRDPVPDEFTLGGGQAIPLAEGIAGLSIQAYDGVEWREQWDSDEDGLPRAVRIIVTASGHTDWDDFAESPLISLRTVIPIDRVAPPLDQLLPTEEEELELEEFLEELLANFGAAGQGQQPQGGQGMRPEDFEIQGGVAPVFENDGEGRPIQPGVQGGGTGDRPGSGGRPGPRPGPGGAGDPGSGSQGGRRPAGAGGNRPNPGDIPPE